MPTVADLPPPKPAVPSVPARLLSSASAPSLAITPAADPGYRDCMAALAIVSANPEEDPGYQESWDTYWARVRPQRNRPYNQTSRPISPPKRDKENKPSSFPPNGGGFYLSLGEREKGEIYWMICLNWGDLPIPFGDLTQSLLLKRGREKKMNRNG